MSKREKRVQQVVNHLLGTQLPLHQAMTDLERNDVDFVRSILNTICICKTTNKWVNNVTA